MTKRNKDLLTRTGKRWLKHGRAFGSLFALQAYEDAAALGVPDEARAAYLAQARNAKVRGIAFLFTLPDWWDWWQVDGRWERRGQGANKLCMARKGDLGPYRPGNVYCATNSENAAVIDIGRHTAARRAAMDKAILLGRTARPHLAARGDGHPRAKPVLTPKGRFGSAALAADAFGINPGTATERARLGLQGWAYEA